MPSIVNFKLLQIGSVFKALDTKTYVKTGWKTYSLIGAEEQIVSKELDFAVAFLDEVLPIVQVKRIDYTGLKIPYKILAKNSYFVIPQYSNWEVFYKLQNGLYVYALTKYVNDRGRIIEYNSWTNFDILFIHSKAHVKEIESRTWLKNQQIL